MQDRILILNGPNLNMLGRREPEIYGHDTLDDIDAMCVRAAQPYGLTVDFRQSNYEGELVGWIQEAMDTHVGIIVNAAAYTHTSLAMLDALKLLSYPIVEVHLSDPEQREQFRHFSYVSLAASAIIKGKGAKGYVEAVQTLASLLGRSAAA